MRSIYLLMSGLLNRPISLYETYSVGRGALRNGRCVEDRLIDFCGRGAMPALYIPN